MDQLWILRGLAGGALIGLSASLMLVMNGRVTGISGMLNALLAPLEPQERVWRVLFLAGLLLGGALTAWFVPVALPAVSPSVTIALAAGALVGVGTRLGNGCTSGHGVCGISRFSWRSIAATLTFISAGAAAVFVLRVLGGVQS